MIKPHTLISLGLAGLGALLLIAATPAGAAKPGGGGGTDPCATPGLDFPAFAYWKANGKNQQIYVADATGKCIRSVAAIKSGTGGGGSIQFSYPVDSAARNRGRVAWVETTAVVGVDFTVDTVTRQIAVFAKSTIYSGSGGAISLSKNGSTLYSTRVFDSGELFIDKLPLDSVGSPAGSPTTVFAAVGSYIGTLTVNDNESMLFADYHPAPGPPTAPWQLVWISPDASNVVNVIVAHAAQAEFSPAADPSSARVVFQDYIPVGSRTDGCEPLVITDINGAQYGYPNAPAYGLKPTWVNGKVLADGRRGPTRTDTGCDYTATIMQLDPVTGVQTALTSGYDPDGK